MVFDLRGTFATGKVGHFSRLEHFFDQNKFFHEEKT